MAKWVPVVSTFGLVCLMVIPAPGIWGIMIGAVCAVAILFSAAYLLIDKLSTKVLFWYEERRKKSAKSRRIVHAGSGMVRKVRA